ncbi:voltage-gated potassium channel [Roseibium hamelinense]|uniref:Voltage-gated potassium channel n=1 Tax=Roseibium hamelinense TaxID=150831 RepID=A0A562T1J1_9HYPH|nr:ion transporter [Roseibium hamelinense]MTI42076.1 ion transporter [Roseibium hamelinense]TWI87153.1 voltage-gated potassium channel [Roseibium hamelinense]
MHDTLEKLRVNLRQLYFGSSAGSRLWRYALLIFDIVTIGYFIVSAMIDPNRIHHELDYTIAAILTFDYIARLIAAPRPWRYMGSFTSIADIIVIVSLIAPAFFENFGFLRVVRMLRLMRSYHLLKELRDTSKWFRRNEEVFQSAVNLVVFIFVVTALVFVVEHDRNENINNYLDALYFTVTTLTTTGFGDITMTDSAGRLMTVAIMIFGVGLFLRLVQTIFRPAKVQFPCPDCGLARHDPDAVHCKHCGRVLNIPTDGEWA